MTYHVAAVDRAFSLLEVMAQYPDLGVTELAERTGNTKSLVFRLLFTLEQRGYVHKSPDARTYRLGYRTLFLAEHTRRQSALIAAAAPVLDELASSRMYAGFDSAHPAAVMPERSRRHQIPFSRVRMMGSPSVTTIVCSC